MKFTKQANQTGRRAFTKRKTALLACLLWLACTPSSETPEEVSRSRTQIDYVLELTQGGGVAGLYKTYRLHADGLLEAHQRIGLMIRCFGRRV